jgi:hypothetical protein
MSCLDLGSDRHRYAEWDDVILKLFSRAIALDDGSAKFSKTKKLGETPPFPKRMCYAPNYRESAIKVN